MSKVTVNDRISALSKALVETAKTDATNAKTVYDLDTVKANLPEGLTFEHAEKYQNFLGELTLASELATAEIGGGVLAENEDHAEFTGVLDFGATSISNIFQGKTTIGEKDVFGHVVSSVHTEFTGDLGAQAKAVRADIASKAKALFGAKK